RQRPRGVFRRPLVRRTDSRGKGPTSLWTWDWRFRTRSAACGGVLRFWFRQSDEPAAAGWIDLDPRRSVCAVNQPAIWKAAMVHVECHAGEMIALVGFPLVNLAVAIGIFFGTDERVVLVVL